LADRSLVLGIDTATRFGSVGVVAVATSGRAAAARNSSTVELLAEVSREAGQAHGAMLLGLIDECLARAAEPLERVSAIAISIGPGSFTGLRVGLATAKGLALAGGCDLVGVPTLEVLAQVALEAAEGEPGGGSTILICPCLDARRGQVYAALFDASAARGGRPARLTPDAAWAPEALGTAIVDRLEDTRLGPTPCVVLAGDGAERYRAAITEPAGERAHVLPAERFYPRGGVVARLGAAEMALRGGDEIASLVPRYARPSDAEVARMQSTGVARKDTAR
jgi:tRNA threonylcarbamoyladenosine biosynthesis protein TsaB